MTVTVPSGVAVPGHDPGPRPGDVLPLPVHALLDLGMPVEPEQTAAIAAAARWPWVQAPSRVLDGPARLIIAVLAITWSTRPLSRHGLQLRPTVRQGLLARQLVTASGAQAAGLVAHVCARVLPADPGTAVSPGHTAAACLRLFHAWAGSPVRERGEEAERVAWRLATALAQVRWVDETLRQAEIAGALALCEAWRAVLPAPAAADLAEALNEAWDQVHKTRTGPAGTVPAACVSTCNPVRPRS